MIISLTDFLEKKAQFALKAQAGKLFFYPTDTIYGIGSIISPETVQKIDQFKRRQSGKYYSIIAPSFGRMKDHFQVDTSIEEERANQSALHGPLTVLLPKKKSAFLSDISDNDRVGVRYLIHPLQVFISKLQQPFITTSVNLSGKPSLTSPTQLTAEQEKNIDIIIDAGVLENKPSTILRYGTREKIRF